MVDTLEAIKGGIPQTQRWPHRNSKKAFGELSISRRARQILDFCVAQAKPMTDREIMQGLGYSDMNSCRPRISELIDFGKLREAGDTIDTTTHKKVRLVAIRHEQQDSFI